MSAGNAKTTGKPGISLNLPAAPVGVAQATSHAFAAPLRQEIARNLGIRAALAGLRPAQRAQAQAAIAAAIAACLAREKKS